MPSKLRNTKKGNFQYSHAVLSGIRSTIQSIKKFGVHTVAHMSAGGFQYTGNGNAACCKDCGLEVSNLTSDMNPFTIHSQRRPDCPFVCSIMTSSSANIPAPSSPPKTTIRNPTTASALENPSKHDPCDVHKTLSPNCIYVKAKLIRPTASSIIIVNENSTVNTSDIRSGTASNFGPLRSNDIVFTASCNPAYSEIPKRHASYTAWPIEDLPSVDDLVRAGFFY
ncbi:unnamed protein product, partial [Rotaria socialis]